MDVNENGRDLLVEAVGEGVACRVARQDDTLSVWVEQTRLEEETHPALYADLARALPDRTTLVGQLVLYSGHARESTALARATALGLASPPANGRFVFRVRDAERLDGEDRAALTLAERRAALLDRVAFNDSVQPAAMQALPADAPGTLPRREGIVYAAHGCNQTRPLGAPPEIGVSLGATSVAALLARLNELEQAQREAQAVQALGRREAERLRQACLRHAGALLARGEHDPELRERHDALAARAVSPDELPELETALSRRFCEAYPTQPLSCVQERQPAPRFDVGAYRIPS